ncbi:MerR family transcriptional regulator [Streptomyces sp. NPDC001787]|uniref:DNA polymerase III subunit beta family protein n=1 Tax=Streptomyces sp. NPDC001787 TaxID=3154523 RepID=UPI0033198A93
MDDIDALMSIGAFGRRVGLAPSALRFYDDCDVLRPAHVDVATGYRYYAPDQVARAVLARRLRAAGVPLGDASVVLDGTDEEARAVLEEHAGRVRETAASAQSAIAAILHDLPAGTRRVKARVGGAELAGAVRQVAPSVGSAAAREEFPALGCVLIELGGEEVRLVATDRYRLAVRALRPTSVEGDAYQVLVDAREMKDLAAWAVRLPDVSIEVDRNGAWLRGGGDSRALPTVDETFPDYRMILDDLPDAPHRVITARAALGAALDATGTRGTPVVLRTGEQQLTLTVGESAATTLPALCTGPPLRIAFDAELLRSALDAAVGPDVLLEIVSPVRPVVVRSADQGSFTTLVMPVRDAGAEA